MCLIEVSGVEERLAEAQFEELNTNFPEFRMLNGSQIRLKKKYPT